MMKKLRRMFRTSGRLMRDLHVTLRTERATRLRSAFAVSLGAFVGAFPIYGFHLPVCFVLARILRLSRARTYLAAWINNPWTAPFLITGEWAIGHRLLPPEALQNLKDLLHFRALAGTVEVFLGATVIGGVLAALFFVSSLLLSRDSTAMREATLWIDPASAPFLDGGIFEWEFARSKYRYDPVYATLRSDPGFVSRSVVDLGCGDGLAAGLLYFGLAPETDPPEEYFGIDASAKAIRRARKCLGERARFEVGDISAFPPPPATTILMIDVLHYLPLAGQDQALDLAVEALAPGGRLFLREADAAAGRAFRRTASAERWRARFRRGPMPDFHFRTAAEWRHALTSRGLTVQAQDSSEGTPFANILLIADRGQV
jgi:uncharacterized protein (DUF2062 family)/trans-aconitate methyltransferase